MFISFTTQDDYWGSCNTNHTMEWADIVTGLSVHVVTEDKNSAKMIAGCTSVEGNPKTLYNCLDYHMLILDYDDGLTVDEFINQYTHLEYCLYTSFSHLKDDVTHKFRVVLPLAQSLSRDSYAERKTALFGIFPDTDVSTFSRFRMFSMPSAPAERKHLTRVHYNSGKVLDIVPLPAVPLKQPLTKEQILELSGKRDKAIIDPVKQARQLTNIRDKYQLRIGVHGYNDMRQFAIELASIALPLDEIVNEVGATNHPQQYCPQERALSGYDWWLENDGSYRQSVTVANTTIQLLM